MAAYFILCGNFSLIGLNKTKSLPSLDVIEIDKNKIVVGEHYDTESREKHPKVDIAKGNLAIDVTKDSTSKFHFPTI